MTTRVGNVAKQVHTHSVILHRTTRNRRENRQNIISDTHGTAGAAIIPQTPSFFAEGLQAPFHSSLVLQ